MLALFTENYVNLSARTDVANFELCMLSHLKMTDFRKLDIASNITYHICVCLTRDK
jgi:hypothetical protein